MLEQNYLKFNYFKLRSSVENLCAGSTSSKLFEQKSYKTDLKTTFESHGISRSSSIVEESTHQVTLRTNCSSGSLDSVAQQLDSTESSGCFSDDVVISSDNEESLLNCDLPIADGRCRKVSQTSLSCYDCLVDGSCWGIFFYLTYCFRS